MRTADINLPSQEDLEELSPITIYWCGMELQAVHRILAQPTPRRLRMQIHEVNYEAVASVAEFYNVAIRTEGKRCSDSGRQKRVIYAEKRELPRGGEEEEREAEEDGD